MHPFFRTPHYPLKQLKRPMYWRCCLKKDEDHTLWPRTARGVWNLYTFTCMRNKISPKGEVAAVYMPENSALIKFHLILFSRNVALEQTFTTQTINPFLESKYTEVHVSNTGTSASLEHSTKNPNQPKNQNPSSQTEGRFQRLKF